jgi:alpha-glucuronidase
VTRPSWQPCWLRYERLSDGLPAAALRECARSVSVVGRDRRLDTAVAELRRGIASLLGSALTLVAPGRRSPADPGLVLGTLAAVRAAEPGLLDGVADPCTPEGFVIHGVRAARGPVVALVGVTGVGVLHAVFRFLAIVAARGTVDGLSIVEDPVNPLRMVTHWDNLDGSIERGYAGRSLFFAANRVLRDLARVRDYARLLASVGVNAVCINNVNVHARESRLIAPGHLPRVARIAREFRRWGIRLFLSVNFAAPLQDGGLATADPLDPDVGRFWRKAAGRIYRRIPDFGGFMVKADSEGRPGPFSYGRTHADGANMLAESLAPYGGIVLWRCFVYNHRQDWRDRTVDRARAALDHFLPLDGAFADNVVLQCKNGPMDFQVREPVSPLFGALERTNVAMELQVTQEYTGQQRHLCFLVPQWKEYLDVDTAAPLPAGRPPSDARASRVASGALFRRPRGGLVGVSNVGDEANWTGHDLAQANLFGFGRLAWNPDLSADRIADEWICLTFGDDPVVAATLRGMLMESWSVYESCTAPLGVGWMVNPGHHYGPSPDGYEYSAWGTYHHADCRGVGVERTAAAGTGFTAQYRRERAARYESLADCPDELLLFFHHVPYGHVLKSGKTVIQHIYDSHFAGAARAAGFVESWRALRGRIDEERWASVLARLEEQRAHAAEWRDVVNAYFHRKSGIDDERGRVVF